MKDKIINKIVKNLLEMDGKRLHIILVFVEELNKKKSD